MKNQMALVIRPRYQSGRIVTYRFRVVENPGRDKGTTIFSIPAQLHWNDQLKRDISASIRDVLKDVYTSKDIDNLQAQAWELMQGIE